ncbi:hypothetical protein T459_11972 [Capsicum annuum]|uniref:Uncharacterized protein n=1 Tax=Capsicum annuum TaxID=4072 RepID=A0A2G2ZNG4_CAPAN|nr:hypothetical protein T459_11972 [Capsicum annuum]
MLMQQHATSLICPIPVLKPLMATLDSSTSEIPSPSMESIDEKQDEFGHKLLFKGNEQDVDRVVVLTPTHSNNKVEAKRDQKSGTNIKSWEDMVGEEKQAPSPPTCSKLSPAASKFVPSYTMAKRYEIGDLAEDPIEVFEGDLGVDIFDEEDEDEVLDECFAKVARGGDL